MLEVLIVFAIVLAPFVYAAAKETGRRGDDPAVKSADRVSPRWF